MKTSVYRVQFPDHKFHKTSLSVLRVSPDSAPKYVLQLVHGISEKKERYLPLMEFMASHGAEVILHDLPGHGASASSAAELGVMNNPGYDYEYLRLGIDGVFASLACDDITEDSETGQMIVNVHKENLEYFPDIPRFLLGHSMGSLIAGLYTARQGDTLDGLILSGLPFRHRSASLGVFLMTLLECICGEESKPKWVNHLAFSAYNRRFTPEPESDGQFMWLSCDIGNRYEFLADPLCNTDKAICTFTNLLRMVRDFYRPAMWNKLPSDLPVLLMAGDEDPVAGGKKQVLSGQKFLGDMGLKNVSALMYKGFRHEIFMDWCREQAFADVLRFCEDNLAAALARLDQIRAEYEPQFSPDSPEA